MSSSPRPDPLPGNSGSTSDKPVEDPDAAEFELQSLEPRKLLDRLLSETKRLNESQYVAGVGSWETDLATLKVTWSAETFRIFETSPDELEPTHERFLSFVHPDDRKRVSDAFTQSAGQAGRFSIEHRLLFPDGRVKFVEERWQTFRDAAGRATHAVGTCQDITERKTQEEALRRSELEFRTLAETVHQIVWITLPNGENSYCNQHWVDYTGLTLDECHGLGWNKPIHPDDLQRTIEAWDKAVQTVGPYSLEARIRRFDGEYRWWLIRGNPLRDADGNVLKWFGTCTDIHELKLAEIEISRTNRALKMLSACNEAMVRAEQEQTLLDQVCLIAVEHGGYRMAWVGYARDDEARSIQPVAHAGFEDEYLAEINASWSDDQPCGSCPAGQTICSGKLYVCENLQNDPSNAPWREIAAQRGYKSLINLPLQTEGRTFGLLGLFGAEARAPTADELKLLQELADNLAFGIGNLRARVEAKQLQEAQMLAARRTELAARASKVGIWDWDLVEGTLHWDDQMYALYGASPNSESADINLWERHHHPEDAERMKAEIDEALRPGGRPFDTQFRITRHDTNEVRHIRAQAVVLRDLQNRPIRMLGTNWDVTDQVEREAALREKLNNEVILRQQALAGEKAKSEFLAVMSHEIRTPMNGVLGFAELLASSPTLSPEDRELSQTIILSGEALLRILDDVLDFSRIEAGRLAIDPQNFSLRELVNGIQKLFALQVLEKGLEFEIQFDGDMPDALEGDPGRIRQILVNLIGNALKFTESGSIQVSVNLSTDESAIRCLEFFIRDTGPGISSDRAQAIFEAFTQEDSSISRRHGGTGLGLTIARRLAELMGGTLLMTSQPGQGTVFSLRIPLQLPQAFENAETETAVPSPGMTVDFSTNRPLRILLVEDDTVNLKLLVTILRRLGYEPLLASNGAEAVSVYAREKPDCIFMDLQMPEMDGIEATRAIRNYEIAQMLSPAFISALTANTLPESQQRCFNERMNAYLNKPVKTQSIANMLVEAWKFRGQDKTSGNQSDG